MCLGPECSFNFSPCRAISTHFRPTSMNSIRLRILKTRCMHGLQNFYNLSPQPSGSSFLKLFASNDFRRIHILSNLENILISEYSECTHFEYYCGLNQHFKKFAKNTTTKVPNKTTLEIFLAQNILRISLI